MAIGGFPNPIVICNTNRNPLNRGIYAGTNIQQCIIVTVITRFVYILRGRVIPCVLVAIVIAVDVANVKGTTA